MYVNLYVHIRTYIHTYSHPGVLKNAAIFDPIYRIWIAGGFQPSVHSETASSTIFYLWVWKMTFSIIENPWILSTPGWLKTHNYMHTYVHK